MLDDRFYVSHGPLTIADIIEGLEVELPDPKFLDETISHVAQLVDAEPGAIVFLASKKSIEQLENCKATACFVNETLSHHVGTKHIIPLITKFPRAHFGRAMSRLATLKTVASTTGEASVSNSAMVHPSAIIGAGSVIGDNVTIGANSVIGPGVEIDARCDISSNVTIEATQMGRDCVIKAGAVIGGRGFGIDKDESGTLNLPHFGRVIMGDNVQVGANSCVDRGQIGDTKLGNDVKLDNLVQIAHNVEIGDGSRLAAQTGISGSCKIGRNVMMGGSVGMADHINIGDGAQIAARAGIMHDVPAGEFWGGTPAQPMRDFMREVATVRKMARKSKKKT